MLMHRLVYEAKEARIVAYCRNKQEEMISFDDCFETNFAEKLPGVFSRRDTKVFSNKKILNSLNTVERIECIGPVKYSDLKKFLPSVFDIRYINKVNDMRFIEKNKSLIIKLASEVIGQEEALKILQNR